MSEKLTKIHQTNSISQIILKMHQHMQSLPFEWHPAHAIKLGKTVLR